MTTKLIKALREDKDFFYAWQSNIAVAFQDEVAEFRTKKKYLNRQDVHKISNDSAIRFLNNLIND